ncbi:lactate utilization protein [Paracoccus sp. SY]|uniref:LutC/YkgG family protein n=1 Tax=Paracoccus sp. SY TaxID=1330255 RepID=UPI000CD1539F|nr:lactate utilization protein [Paracoccus sp. SY]
MTARDRILSAIRNGLGSRRPDPDAIAAEAAALLADPQATRPQLAAPDLAEAFALKAMALGTTIDHVPDMAAVPAALRRYLADHGLPGVALQPAAELATLDWDGTAIHTDIAADEAAGLGLARWGIAESGSLVIHSGTDNPILLSFLPLHHILVLRRNDLLPHLEDYAAAMQGRAQPRNAILITGPSGTTDIEGSYVRGAHGPGFLHVLLVGP